MKKFLALVLVLVMLFSFSACVEESTGDNTDNSSGNTQENNQDNNSTNNKTEETITFTELTAVDNDECSIKLTKITPDSLLGYSIKAQLENKSAEKTYMFSVEYASINGVECDPLFASEVAPGKKANESITFMDSSFDDNDIGLYTDIEISFRVYDSNDWLADPVAETTVHVYPYGEEKAVKFNRDTKDSDNVIIDNENISFIVTGYEQDEIWGYTINIFLVNKTDKNIMFSVDEASVNGFMVDPFFATTVNANKVSFATISWMESSFEENEITDVETIEFILKATDNDNWLADAIVSQTVTLSPN